MYKTFLILLFATFLHAEVYDGVAVVVQNKAITLLDIQKMMQEAGIDEKKATTLLIRQKLEEAEIEKRKIRVNSSEVYDDIKKMAERNHMDISQFYDAVRNTNGLTSQELKAKIKQKLLTQKLYQSIAYTSLHQPSDAEIKRYYEMHKNRYKHPASFDVIIYDAKERAKLEAKIDNPMFYSPEIVTKEQIVPYEKIAPELASLLQGTGVDHFTPVVPNGKGGFMSFYIKSVKLAKESRLESVRNQVINDMMAQKREEVLSDYFARVQHSADIHYIRAVK